MKNLPTIMPEYTITPSTEAPFAVRYEEMPGWKTDISACKTYDELPEAARKYVERISELVGVPLGIVSVGPNRSQTIILQPIF